MRMKGTGKWSHGSGPTLPRKRAPDRSAPKPKYLIGSAGVALAILAVINLLSYLDRYIVAAVAESLKQAHLGLTDANLGSLMSGFLVVYTITAPIFGALGDRRPRPRLIALGVAIWSVATALGGFARNFAALFAARATVGVGEAAYGTIAPALLDMGARALAWPARSPNADERLPAVWRHGV